MDKTTIIKRKVSYLELLPEYSNKERSKIVIIPVPYDGTSTWIKGSDKGPDALMDASANLELYDIETDSEVYKNGIFTEDPIKESSSPEDMIESVYSKVTVNLKKNKFIVVIGGEHSVSIGAVKSFAEKYKDLNVLQLDAHADLRQEYNGSKNNHACVIARIREICPIVQVGIRSMDVSEKKYIDNDKIFFAEDLQGDDDWIDNVVTKLSRNVYLTLDLDVFDPSIMPSTGTPEPGGLLWYTVLKLLKKVIEKRNIVGFDVTELCPNENNR
ncbi:agmatinase, partial [Candidatus Woesearchaeota archaeon]|nr:agmatinase [Candidatus Woesearchaeota archaeon]